MNEHPPHAPLALNQRQVQPRCSSQRVWSFLKSEQGRGNYQSSQVRFESCGTSTTARAEGALENSAGGVATGSGIGVFGGDVARGTPPLWYRFATSHGAQWFGRIGR